VGSFKWTELIIRLGVVRRASIGVTRTRRESLLFLLIGIFF
jgi:hypothetical protein